jgi:succinylglutamate desuccinylase
MINHMPKTCKATIEIRGSGKPVVAVIGSMHGDEPVGARVISALKRRPVVCGTLVTIVGNPAALKKEKRYLDEDLNRCFPGKKSGSREAVLAHEIMHVIRSADYCIDIHSTTTNTTRALIVKRKTAGVKKLIALTDPDHVVIMPKGVGEGSLINHHNAAVSLEYGRHHASATYAHSLRATLSALERLGMIRKKPRVWKTRTPNHFRVYGTEPKPKGLVMAKGILNLRLVEKGDLLGTVRGKKIFASESFYPFLFGPKAYPDIMGFKAKKTKGF